MHATPPAAHCSTHSLTPLHNVTHRPAMSHNTDVIVFLFSVVVFQAHAHVIGIDPAHRGVGLGARLYQHFFQAIKDRGCTLVHCVTSPYNTASVAFHRTLGFEPVRVASSGGGGQDGGGAEGGEWSTGASDGEQAEKRAPADFVRVGYDGPDEGDRVLMEKRL